MQDTELKNVNTRAEPVICDHLLGKVILVVYDNNCKSWVPFNTEGCIGAFNYDPQ